VAAAAVEAVAPWIGWTSCWWREFCWSFEDMQAVAGGHSAIIGGMIDPSRTETFTGAANPSPARATLQSVKTHRDARGTLFEPLTDAELQAQKNVHVVLTQPNEVRGNHVHRTAVETTTVVGPCRVRLKEQDEIKDIDVAEGEILRLTIPPGVVHAFRNTGNAAMLLVSFSTNLHDPEGADTQRVQIL
jgi:dTDP-4-dehydrorhamnose 3,5-epimerase-like enzyme